MNERCSPRGLAVHEPRFLKTASILAEDLRKMSADKLSELFSCSIDIAETNHRRYSIFGTDEAEVMPAALAYHGQAYKHLRADELMMEGGFPLPCTGGKKVSEFWRPLLTDVLIESVNKDDGVLVYLDTEEFRQLFDWKRVVLEVPTIIEPEFHVLKGNKLTTPSVWAKTCRGAMTRYIIENRIADPEELKGFSYEGFSYTDGWSFIKEQ